MKKLIITAFITLVVLQVSCNKLLNVSPTRVVPESTMWTVIGDTQAGLMGIYALTRAALSDNNRYWIYGDVRLADFTGTVREDLKAIHNNQLNASYPLVDALSNWRVFYAAINAANLFIERAPNVLKTDPLYTQQNLNVDLAQARALRAFNYFYLVRLWGDVPFIITSHDGDFVNKPRESQQKVLAYVEQELLAVISFLPISYGTTLYPEQVGPYYGSTSWGQDLVRKTSVWALLAHVYAWEGNYAGAAQYAQTLISNATAAQIAYLSTAGVRNMFRGEATAEANDIILGFGHRWRAAEESFTGVLEDLTLGAPLAPNRPLPAISLPKDSIVSVFNEAGDGRFDINNPIISQWFSNYDRQVPIFGKVFIYQAAVPINQSTPYTQYEVYSSSTVITRLEDMDLLLAEAQAVLNDPVSAATNLNIVRQKRGLKVYDPTKNGPIIDAIFKERQRELMGEGWRWFDLVRYKKIKNNDTKFNQLISSGGIYWPIASSLLVQNPLLKQNPYWQ